MSILKVNTIQDKGGNTIISSDGAGTLSGGLASNTPAFSAKLSANQEGISQNAYTKVQCDSEDFDTDSAYDNATNYRFTVPSGQAGKYLFTASINAIDWGGSFSTLDLYSGAFYKNGSLEKATIDINGAAVNNNGVSLSAIIDLSESDYVELYVKVETGSGTGKVYGGSNTTTWFQGYKLIGA